MASTVAILLEVLECLRIVLISTKLYLLEPKSQPTHLHLHPCEDLVLGFFEAFLGQVKQSINPTSRAQIAHHHIIRGAESAGRLSRVEGFELVVVCVPIELMSEIDLKQFAAAMHYLPQIFFEVRQLAGVMDNDGIALVHTNEHFLDVVKHLRTKEGSVFDGLLARLRHDPEFAVVVDERIPTQGLQLHHGNAICVLLVFLLCFEAAINALPFSPPIRSTTGQVPGSLLTSTPSHIKVWEFKRNHLASLKSSHELEALPASYRRVYAALRKQNICDHFCFFLEASLRVKLAELDLGTVRWMRFKPHPLAFYAEIMLNQGNPSSHLKDLKEEPQPMHSVLEMKTNLGEELIFDGTPEQFGWSDLAWTQDKKDVEVYYVEGQTGMVEFHDDKKWRLKKILLELILDHGVLCTRRWRNYWRSWTRTSCKLLKWTML
ncbi:uncharacterized protein M421DRAFT_9959 [Didymella exigua CBS 183.55]|uniref:Uncharacterized protein n=1 Tax=Didymella exigua CBS 183.55 TaxID=1150837 RepID=A0A6A5R5R3_9PLEO|nr:uncharacterized protein M421DRAFT_9959 [Didymella exigua CBS 183.55]KAF1923052.1 hypothetical protein M421DRAFT_9959 [Didymella exigua CBS 183.55]